MSGGLVAAYLCEVGVPVLEMKNGFRGISLLKLTWPAFMKAGL